MRPGYEWIPTEPAPPPPPPPAPRRGKHRRSHGRPWTDATCGRCGWGPFGWYKLCAACHGPRPTDETGHLGALEQYVWVVFLVVFFILAVRLVGMTF